MANKTREEMIAAAALLLAKKGLQATSFSEVLEATGAPRGSLYHHFPGGKDELVHAAIELASARMFAVLDTLEGKPADEIAAYFLNVWRTILTRSKLTAGCAVVAVTVAAESKSMLEQTAGVFRRWRERLGELLHHGGIERKRADRLAAMLVAGSEGAVVVARGEQSLDPFELVAAELLDQVRAAIDN